MNQTDFISFDGELKQKKIKINCVIDGGHVEKYELLNLNK